MKDTNSIEYAKWLGFYYLGFRMHSRHELKEKLQRKKIVPQIIDEALSFFEEEGYLDDFAYACAFIRDSANLRNDGANKIRSKLYAKHIPTSIIDRAFSATEEEVNPQNSLNKLIAAKLRTLDINDKKDKDKLIRSLIAKGFSYDDVKKALQNVEKEEETPI